MTTALQVSDPVLDRWNGGLFKGKFQMVFARFELERDRLVVYEHSRWLAAMGLIGLLIARKRQGKRTIELEFTKIATIGRGKFGLNKKILDVTTTDGQSHRFQLEDEASARIRLEIAQRARLVDAGEERWQVMAA
jgi:hypothetical protein